jgi:shikimate dehydrogenase
MKLCVIGYPIGHSLSPAMYNSAFPELGIEASYEAWAVPPDELPDAIGRLRAPDMLGMNVTVPHKQAVMPLLDEVDANAKAIGAVNCISKASVRLVGHNTDEYGFLRSLREAGFEPAGKQVLLLGNGGAARAVAHGLIEVGVARLTVAGRSPERVDAFAGSLKQPQEVEVRTTTLDHADLASACRDADLIVNSTTLGMRHGEGEGQSPLLPDLIAPGVFVYDLVYNPIETPLLTAARKAGARPIGGLDMLVYQAVEAVRLWTGLEAPADLMREAALRTLAARE